MSDRLKVMGTKYYLELDLEKNEWYIRLVMDNSVEEEVKIDSLTRSQLEDGLLQLFDRFYLPLNDFQKEKIAKDFIGIMKETKNVELDTSAGIEEDEKTPPVTSIDNHGKIPKRSAMNLQHSLVGEFRNKISGFEKPEIKPIDIVEIEEKDTESAQITELVRSHRNVEKTLKNLDQRLTTLEQLTSKLLEITEMMLQNM